MDMFSRGARRSSFRWRASSCALLVWIAVSALGAVACARAHRDRAQVDDGRGRDDDETSESVNADDNDDEDMVPVGAGPTYVPGAPTGGSQPGAEPLAEPATSELMEELFVEYQRDGPLRCPCHVASRVYGTLEECLAASVRQRPQVDDCLDKNVPADALRELHRWVRCITDIKREHNDCLEQGSCADEASCGIDTKRCVFPDLPRVAAVLSKCPQAITIGP